MFTELIPQNAFSKAVLVYNETMKAGRMQFCPLLTFNLFCLYNYVSRCF